MEAGVILGAGMNALKDVELACNTDTESATIVQLCNANAPGQTCGQEEESWGQR